MEREIKTIKTPVDGHELEIYTYLTGGDNKKIQNVFLSAAKLAVDADGKFNGTELNGDLSQLATDKALELLIKSVNGKTENILTEVEAMKVEDYDFVIKAINEIQSPNKKKQKN